MYEEANAELMRRLERDEEKEPRARFVARPRRKQFRYWSGLMFRPARGEFSAPEIFTPPESSRVVQPSKRGGRYEPMTTENDPGSLSPRVVQTAKRAVNNSPIVDGKNPSAPGVGSSQRCAILGREA